MQGALGSDEGMLAAPPQGPLPSLTDLSYERGSSLGVVVEKILCETGELPSPLLPPLRQGDVDAGWLVLCFVPALGLQGRGGGCQRPHPSKTLSSGRPPAYFGNLGLPGRWILAGCG